MADTPFELSMDDYVFHNLTWTRWVQFRNHGNWVTNQADIKEGLDYRVGFRVTNMGSETAAKNVEIRVANWYPQRVTFFEDGTYAQPVQQSNKNFPNKLAPNQVTDWHWVYFRLGPGPDELASIARVGVYAEIIPLGHSWTNFSAALD